jgi:translation initiation factor RLI1
MSNSSETKKPNLNSKKSPNKTDLVIAKHRKNFNSNYFSKINEKIRLFILTKKIINEKKQGK